METQAQRKKWNKEADGLINDRIDKLNLDQCKGILKYLIDHASHNKRGEPVMLIYDHKMIKFDSESPGKGNDCFVHTFVDALEIAEGIEE